MSVPDDVREAAIASARSHLKTLVCLGVPDVIPTDAQIGAAFDAALSALEAAGWVCVPKVPTLAMIRAGMDNNPTVFTQAEPGFARDVANDVYVAMVRAAMLTASRHKEKQDG